MSIFDSLRLKEEIIVYVISFILGSSVLNDIITHFLYNNKLRKELKNRGDDIIANGIAESLCSFRDLELQITDQEIYDAENELNKRGSSVNFFEGEVIYPVILNDWSSFNSFLEQVRICRKRYERNLSCRLALNLAFIERYLMQLSLFVCENGGETTLPLWGTIIYYDLQKWQKRIDRLLIKEINKHIYKLESHAGRKWAILRGKEWEKQYKDTVLHFLLTNECPAFQRRRMNALRTYLDLILEENE